jgi:hypothetical protein
VSHGRQVYRAGGGAAGEPRAQPCGGVEVAQKEFKPRMTRMTRIGIEFIRAISEIRGSKGIGRWMRERGRSEYRPGWSEIAIGSPFFRSEEQRDYEPEPSAARSTLIVLFCPDRSQLIAVSRESVQSWLGCKDTG